MQGNDLAMKMLRMWNDGSPELADEVFSPDFRSHTSQPGMEGIEGQKRTMEVFFRAFSEMRYEMPFFSMEGDTMIVRFEGSARHTGEFFGVAPTDKLVCMGGVSILRVKDGRVSESWDYYDSLGLMRQLGVLPGMETEGTGGSHRAAA